MYDPNNHTTDCFLTLQSLDRLVEAVDHSSVGDAKMRHLGTILKALRENAQGDKHPDQIVRLSVGILVPKTKPIEFEVDMAQTELHVFNTLTGRLSGVGNL